MIWGDIPLFSETPNYTLEFFEKIRLYILKRCIFAHQRWDSKNLSGSPRHDGRAPCLPAGTPRSPTAPTGCHSCSGHNGLQQLAGFVSCKCSLLGESIHMVLQVRVKYDLYININFQLSVNLNLQPSIYCFRDFSDPDGRVFLVKDRGNPEDLDPGDLKHDNWR